MLTRRPFPCFLIFLLLSLLFFACDGGRKNASGKVVVPPSFFSRTWPKEIIPQLKIEIAQAMSQAGEAALDFPDTVATYNGLMDHFSFGPTVTIADIGAGTGGFEVMLLQRNIPFGKIYVVDVDPVALDLFQFILQRCRSPRRRNIETVLCAPNDLRLPPDSVDRALISNTPQVYKQRDQVPAGGPWPPTPSLVSLFQAMKSGGRVYVFHHLGEDSPEGKDFRHLRPTFMAAGFLCEKENFVRIGRAEMQFFLFIKPPVE